MIGKTVAHYKISGLLGKAGMSEMYRNKTSSGAYRSSVQKSVPRILEVDLRSIPKTGETVTWSHLAKVRPRPGSQERVLTPNTSPSRARNHD
jgi:hypothetical protein